MSGKIRTLRQPQSNLPVSGLHAHGLIPVNDASGHRSYLLSPREKPRIRMEEQMPEDQTPPFERAPAAPAA